MCARVVNHISQYNKKAKLRTSGQTVLIRIENYRLKREDKKTWVPAWLGTVTAPSWYAESR